MTGTITRKTGRLHVHVFGFRPVRAINFSRDQSSDKLINFLDSQLDTRSSRLDTRNYRGSSLEARGTVNLILSGTVYVSIESGALSFQMELSVMVGHAIACLISRKIAILSARSYSTISFPQKNSCISKKLIYFDL